MFIWDFVANPVMDALVDWFYSQVVGFLGAFFAQMGNMGVELFELEWVQAVVQFFSQLGWACTGSAWGWPALNAGSSMLPEAAVISSRRL